MVAASNPLCMTVSNDTVLAIVENEQTRPVCTPAAVCASKLMFERVVRPADPGSPPTRTSDIWSLASMISELILGAKIFPVVAQNDVLLGSMATLCGEVPKG
jgi:serine/threonine-protein kinase SRPK3